MVNMYQHEQVVESLFTTIAMLIVLKIVIKMKNLWTIQQKKHFKFLHPSKHRSTQAQTLPKKDSKKKEANKNRFKKKTPIFFLNFKKKKTLKFPSKKIVN